MLTGEGDRGVDLIAGKRGAADYLVKAELRAALLERSIRYAVERGRTIKALRDANELRSLHLAKNAFLTNMSHEMRTPMNAILGMADMLRESPLNGQQIKCLAVLGRAGSRLLVLINDVLDLARIGSGQFELQRGVFELREIVDQALESIADSARSKGLEVLVRLAPGLPPWLLGDLNRLRQILSNLLANAVKFTSSGEIVLTAHHPKSGSPGQIEFAVSDTGIGFPPDKFATIFDDFGQADASSTRKFGGVGVGLGICRRLVDAMGGTLTATSTEGQGSTFLFSVQFDAAPAPGAKASVAPSEWRADRVLLIDDDAASSVMLVGSLEAWGLESTTFQSGKEALAGLREGLGAHERYALAVIANSEISGIKASQTAAEIERIAPDLPVVTLVSNTQARAHFLRLVDEALGKGAPAEADQREKEPIKPARILLVDDSPDNQWLVQVYLQDGPYRLTFEENGKAAVERFAKADFDLILMDIQMPVMNGITAIRAIRMLEKERGTPLIPILALTANTAFEDMQRSMDAGASAHFAKPISKSVLLGAVEKYLQPKALPVVAPKSLAPTRIEMPPDIEKLVPAYLERRREEVAEMLRFLTQSDFARLAQLGHDLKGSGGSYGFPELTRLGAVLEESAKRKDPAALGLETTELHNYLERVQLIAAP